MPEHSEGSEKPLQSDPMQRLARRIARDRTIARRRSLARRAMGPLFWKYVQIVPSVFTARGEFAAWELNVPVATVLDRLRDSAILTLDSASELLGGFRFGSGRHIYAYFDARLSRDAIDDSKIGRQVEGRLTPLLLTARNETLLLAVFSDKLPPNHSHAGHRTVTPDHLAREFLGYYGLRIDWIAPFEKQIVSVFKATSGVGQASSSRL